MKAIGLSGKKVIRCQVHIGFAGENVSHRAFYDSHEFLSFCLGCLELVKGLLKILYKCFPLSGGDVEMLMRILH